MSSLFNMFPQIDVHGSYDPFKQLINLNSLDKIQFDSEIKNGLNERNIRVFSLLEHEYAHWLDHNSTLWGHNHLLLLYNSLNARANLDEYEFWRIKKYHDLTVREKYFDFYTYEQNKINGSFKNPWSISQTIGFTYDGKGKPNKKKPILFARFATKDGVPIIRVPITVASILESNAICRELNLKNKYVESLSDSDHKLMLNLEYNKSYERIFYSSDKALYNVNTHLASNKTSSSNAYEAVQIASLIGTLTLNLPESEVSNLKIDYHPIHQKNFTYLRQNNDPGFVFRQILENSNAQDLRSDFKLDRILLNSGLSDIKTISKNVESAMQENIKNLINGPFYEIGKKVLQNALANFKKRGLFGLNYALDYDSLPWIIFGDTYYDDSNFDETNALKELESAKTLSREELYHLLDVYLAKFDEFVKACIN